MENQKYAAFESARPYFELVRRALGGVINGRVELMDRFKGYCEHIELQSADRLVVHEADEGRVVVIEYEVHGRILATDVGYDNRFCSIIRLANRRIAHWRDYMDSLAAWNALTANARS